MEVEEVGTVSISEMYNGEIDLIVASTSTGESFHRVLEADRYPSVCGHLMLPVLTSKKFTPQFNSQVLHSNPPPLPGYDIWEVVLHTVIHFRGYV